MSEMTIDNQLDWETFWKKNPTGFNSTMNQSTLFFAENYIKQYPPKENDRLLDLGCGPAFFIDYIKHQFEYIHGTDISKQYIAICKAQYKNQPNLEFSVTDAYDFDGYNDLIIKNQINRVVMLSVLQYYKSTDEVKALILKLKEAANKQHFTLLLADIIPQTHSTIGDIKNIIAHAIKKGYTFKFIKFLFYAVFSDYRKTKKNGLLQIDEAFFTDLARELNLKKEIVKNLTIHTGRYSVLITY